MFRRSILASLLVLGTAATGFAQQITSVVNFASLDNRLAPGALAFVRGTGLNIGSPPVVTVTQGVARAAWVSPNDVSSTQLLIQIPLDATVGAGTLSVGPASYPINVAQYAPGVFSRDSTGTGIGSFLHVNSGLIVSLTTPAAPGESLRIFAVGLGQTNPAGSTGVPFPGVDVPTAAIPIVLVGGMPATVTSSVLLAGSVGFYRITFNVPLGLPKGRYDVVVSMGMQESNAVTLPVTGPFAIPDFDENDVPDLVWQNDATRQVTVNYYGGGGGATITGWNWLNAGGVPGWRVVAVADFDANGVPDLVWQNDTTRQVTVNYYGGAAGAAMTGWNWLNAGGVPGWRVVAAADFDRNGVPDLVWQNDATRQVTVNYYGGTGGATMTGWNWLNAGGSPGWSAVSAADFNADNIPDLVWQNDATRQVTVNYYGGMGGETLTGWNWLNAGGAPGWLPVN